MQAVKRVRFLGHLLLSLILSLTWGGVTPALAWVKVNRVTVKKVTAAPRLTFAQTAVTLTIGDSLANPARAGQPDSKGLIRYQSSNEAIARVSNDGRITALQAGRATITATQAADLPGGPAGQAHYEATVVGPLSASASVAASTWLVNQPVGDGVIPVTASGGIGALRYTIAPALPAGLALAAGTGMLSGQASVESAPARYTVTVSDSAAPPHTAAATFSLGVAPALRLAIARPAWTALVGEAVNATPVTADGGIGALHYAVSPALPAKLTLDAADGAIAGTPAAASALTEYTLTVTDSALPAHAATGRFTLQINDGLHATPAIADYTAMAGDAVHYRPVTASGGIGASRYRVTPALPDGLDLAADSGIISGNASAASPSTAYTLTVTDSASPAHAAAARFTLAVNGALTATAAIPARTVTAGDTVSLTPVTAAGGIGAPRFDIAPALPDGLSMDAASGAIAGTAAAASAAADYRVTVSDSATPDAHRAVAAFSLTVAAALRTSVPNASETHRVADAVSYTPALTSGGVRPYRYTVSPLLPAGLTLDTADGAITGTAAVASPYTSYTYTVTDSATPAHTATGRFALTFEPALTATAASAALNVAAGHAINEKPVTAAGGLGLHRYSVSPALPDGLTLDTISGAITGTAATVSAAAVYTITVTDSAAPAQSATARFTLTVSHGGITAAATDTAHAAAVGDTLRYTPVTASGGDGTLRYAVAPALPAGLSMDTADGLISGTAKAESGLTTYTVTVTDDAASPHSAQARFTLTIHQKLAVTVPAAAAALTASAGEAIRAAPVTAAGGVGALRYSVSPPLPPGLALDASSGLISGAASAESALTPYTITITDSATPAHTATADFTLAVQDALSAAPAVPTHTALVGDAVRYTPVTASGGSGPLRYSVTPPLPDGLSMETDSGVIAGTAATVSAATVYTITVTDNATPAQSATARFTLAINQTLTATAMVAAHAAAVGDTLRYTPVTASGGDGTLRYAVAPTLPAGLSMDTADGLISGTAKAESGLTTYTVTVTDSATPAHTATADFTLAVQDALSAAPAVPTHTALVGDAVRYTPVTASGGSGPLRYSVTPPLPDGLSMETDSGVIAGTAATVSAATVYTITVTDNATPAQSATARFTLAINQTLTATAMVAAHAAAVGDTLRYTPVTASGGDGTLRYAVAPTLPAGLSMDTANGLISGTASAESALTPYTITVTDSATPAHTATADFTLAVQDTLSAAPAVPTHTALVGDAVRYTPVTARGGSGPLRYSVAPPLPDGLSMETDSGVIAGTAATVSAATVYTITVTDNATPAQSATARFTLAINQTLTATAMVAAHAAAVGDTLRYTPVTASGGDGTLRYAVAPTLPAGLSMDTANGLISGTASAESALTPYTITVTDSATPAHAATADFTLAVQDTLSAAPAVPTHTALVGDAVRYTPVTARGGSGPLRYSVAPPLPDGLSMETDSGVIAGTAATVSAATVYTITVTDNATPAQSATARFTLAINQTLTATAMVAAHAAAVGDTLRYTPVTASGGDGTLRYAVAPTLPAGLSMDTANGLISGTASAESALTPYTITVTDSATPAHAASAVFSLAVNLKMQTSVTNSPAVYRIGDAVSYTPMRTTGGEPPYHYRMRHPLPDGLSLDERSGLISGTPTLAQDLVTSYTYSVTDSATPPDSASGSFALDILSGIRAVTLLPALRGTLGDKIDETPIKVTGGLPPYHYSVSPALPVGLMLNAAGALSGSPFAVSPETDYTVTVKDSGWPAQSAQTRFKLTIDGGLIVTPLIKARTAIVGNTVNYIPVTASGGVGLRHYAVSPALPAGLAMDSGNGAIVGTALVSSVPTEYTVTVADDATPAHSDKAAFTLAIDPNMTINVLLARQIVVQGHGLSYPPVQVVGGIGTLRYRVSPALPEGLSVDETTGVITGIPTKAIAISEYTMTVTDGASPPQQVSTRFQIKVNPSLSTLLLEPNMKMMASTTLSSYRPVLATSSDPTSISYSVSPALPTGLTMNNSTGEIKGYPIEASANLYTMTVTDGMDKKTEQFWIEIVAYLRVTVHGIPLRLPNAAYIHFIDVTGGEEPYTLQVTNNSSILEPTMRFFDDSNNPITPESPTFSSRYLNLFVLGNSYPIGYSPSFYTDISVKDSLGHTVVTRVKWIDR